MSMLSVMQDVLPAWRTCMHRNTAVGSSEAGVAEGRPAMAAAAALDCASILRARDRLAMWSGRCRCASNVATAAIKYATCVKCYPGKLNGLHGWGCLALLARCMYLLPAQAGRVLDGVRSKEVRAGTE